MKLITFDRLTKVLAEYADDVVFKYKDNLSISDRRATGSLITSINSKVVVNNNEFSVELDMNKYWKWLEDGRGATTATTRSQPTLYECILEWIKVKPVYVTPKYSMNGKLPDQEQLQKTAAYFITKKIHQEGYEGSKDLEKTLSETDYWEMRIEDALDEDVMEAIDRIFIW